MTTQLQNYWQIFTRRGKGEPRPVEAPVTEHPHPAVGPALEIAPNDPIIPYFQSTSNVVEIERLDLDSPALRQMKEAGVKMVVPLVSQGELIGLLNLGPRLSAQDYSSDDRGLLGNLATQAAPALRVAQLVRQQKEEAQERERIEQELRVARLIQQTLLPKEVPAMSGWHVAAYYRPAREVGGDFYDFLELPDGKLGLVVGDVTDKGVPAALVMATTRSVLRAAALRMDSPGDVLRRVNDLLYPDIPANMFVTCLYAILDPDSGSLQYANAGHDLPYRRCGDGAEELRATGMPLGLMPGMHYEEKEVTLEDGDSVLFYSDGLVEAHNPGRSEMFGFPRLQRLVGAYPKEAGGPMVDSLLEELKLFTGPDWEQEDDITLMTIQRSSPVPGGSDKRLAEFTLPSEPGNERRALERVAEAVEPLHLPRKNLDRLKTAVAEATMNAMEHGNHYRPDAPVAVQVLASGETLSVRITDQGGGEQNPASDEPDLEAKLASQQTPRGWGLFLIKNMVDEMNVTTDDAHHTIELVLHLRGGDHASELP